MHVSQHVYCDGTSTRSYVIRSSNLISGLTCSSVFLHKEHDDVHEQQTDEDEAEVHKKLLQVPPGLRGYLHGLGGPAHGVAGQVLYLLHG